MGTAILRALLRGLQRVPEPTLAGRFTLTFLLLAFWGAAYADRNAILHVACALLATLLLSVPLTHLAAGRLSIERRLPRRVFAGSAFDVRLRLRNRRRWWPALGLSLRDELQTDAAREATCTPEVSIVPPGGAAEVVYAKRMHRRGIRDLDHTLVATRWPFGLFEQRALVSAPGRLVVLPALGRLQRAARRFLADRTRILLSLRPRRDGQEFHGLCDYRPGDPPRAIHWKTSARTGTLVRRVLSDDEGGDHLVVLLDTRVDGARAALRARHFERAVSCAATLLAFAARHGRRAEVRHAAGVASHSGRRASLLAALEQLAAVKAGTGRAEQVVAALPLRRRATLLLLSLAGAAPRAQAVAAERGLRLVVWDLSAPGFGRYFRKS